MGTGMVQDMMAAEGDRQAALKLLGSIFGFSRFRPGQAEIVQSLKAGENLLVVMPTGGGKSICYQIPALLLDGLTIVVSPLTALMDDQVAALRANGAAAAAIHSGMPRAEQVQAWKAAAASEVKLLYMSPERLMTDRMIAALKRRPPVMFVVDEVHCLSRWGVAFRPEYERLAELRTLFPNARIAGFTATADKATRRDINIKLLGGEGREVIRGFDRPNLQLTVRPRQNWKRQLLAFLEPREGEAGIIYCLSRAATEEVAAFLMTQGYNAVAYHAGQPSDMRRAAQNRFMTDRGLVMVATIAFGMGIDKPDIRFVVHLSLPGSMEAYYQEIGRAGRDGEPAETIMLFGLDDMVKRRRFIEEEGGDEAHRAREHKRLDALLAYAEASSCRRRALLAYFDDESAETCGNCDICLNPPKMRDGAREAQILMDTVRSTGSVFGASHIIDIVRGIKTARVQERGHDQLAGFGAGASMAKNWWQAFVRQMLAAGLLDLDISVYGSLRVTARGEDVCLGKASFRYKVPDTVPAPVRKEKGTKRSIASAAPLTAAESNLFEALKAERLRLAQDQDVPAFVIMRDSSLVEMAQKKPKTSDELLSISGVGPKKLEAFGAVFLTVIRQNL